MLAFNPSNNSLSLINSFSSATGINPQSLTSIGGGLFYGTTASGGDSGNGVIFSFDSATGAITTLASFDGANGTTASGALTPGPGGLFFGTAALGGDNGTGTIYSFNPATNTITLLASFDGSGGGHTTGEQSYAALTAAPDGTFYGTASTGGTSGNGTVFAFDPPRPPAPGPLPLIGAGAAFGWSRRLRRMLKPRCSLSTTAT